MRVYAAKALTKKSYQHRVIDPLAGGPRRTSVLAEIEEKALEFANEVILDLELPNAPQVTLGASKGFEDVQKDVNDVVGVIMVQGSFKSLSGVKIRFELPIPVCRGNFQRPSIIVVNGKKHVLSQSFIDKLLERVDTIRPKVQNQFNPDKRLYHQENIEREMFSAPNPQELYFDPSAY